MRANLRLAFASLFAGVALGLAWLTKIVLDAANEVADRAEVHSE